MLKIIRIISISLLITVLIILPPLFLSSCDMKKMPDSHVQTWVVLIDLSGSSVDDRNHNLQEVKDFILYMGKTRPNTIIHLIGFSSYVQNLASGQAQYIVGSLGDIEKTINNWHIDSDTDVAGAVCRACALFRKSTVERKILWILSDGIHDVDGQYNDQPLFEVPIPKNFPFQKLKDCRIHWDGCMEQEGAIWQDAFDNEDIPAIVHTRGYHETVESRVQRLPRAGLNLDKKMKGGVFNGQDSVSRQKVPDTGR